MAELSTLGSVIKTAYEGQPNTNAFTDDEKAKLGDATTGTGITAIVAITQAAYDALDPPVATTLYVIQD